MECALYGVPKSLSEMLRYLDMREGRQKKVEVSERLFRKGTLTASVSCEGRLVLKVYSAPDRSKSRRTLARPVVVTEVLRESEDVQEAVKKLCALMGVLGMEEKAERAYTLVRYKYKGVDIDVIEKKGKTLVRARIVTGDIVQGENALEEVQKDLTHWVGLRIPPGECTGIV